MKPTDVEIKISRNDILRAISYDPQTGEFKWAKGNKKYPPGAVDKFGYRRISINYRRYYAHRLAWLIVHNEWPEDSIDHINGDARDNRISNLRKASHSENKKNEKLRKDNKLGIKGVSLRKSGKYRARIFFEGKHVSLGDYLTPQEAQQAYISAAKKIHGEFMRAG